MSVSLSQSEKQGRIKNSAKTRNKAMRSPSGNEVGRRDPGPRIWVGRWSRVAGGNGFGRPMSETNDEGFATAEVRDTPAQDRVCPRVFERKDL